jgi:hypothetical protein
MELHNGGVIQQLVACYLLLLCSAATEGDRMRCPSGGEGRMTLWAWPDISLWLSVVRKLWSQAACVVTEA